MSSHKTPPRKTYTVAAILCLAPPLLTQGIWWMASNETTNAALRKAEFLSYFPSFMQSSKIIMVFSLGCCLAAILLGCMSFNQKSVVLRLVCIGVVLVASVLALLNILQLL